VGLDDVEVGFGTEADEQGNRLVAATCGGVRVHCVYVPNGRVVGGEHYEAKLAWLEELRSYLERNGKPTDPVAVCGDFNIAPDDRDIYDRAALEGSTHITEPERQALRAIEDWGLVDAFRLFYPGGDLFSWWDYRAGNFHKHLGMRIDLLLLTETLAKRCTYALVDRNARKGKLPSDHAPVFVDVTL
jgi:exodeoxyribonuclease-3